ncbi:unnamed protein product, partial [Heterotrigona itama]
NADYNIVLTHDGPVVLGGTITFKADIFSNNERPSGTFKYKWRDNALNPHEYEVSFLVLRSTFATNKYVFLEKLNLTMQRQTGETSNTTTYWSLNVSHENYTIGKYEVEVILYEYEFFWWGRTSVRTDFYVTRNDSSFLYNFTIPDTSHVLEALVVASYDLPTTTIAPTTTALPITTTVPSNATVPNITTSNVTTERTVTATVSRDNSSVQPTSTMTPVAPPNDATNISISDVNNISLPYICSNSSIIPPDPNKTYGHFVKKIDVRAPITNITVEGTNWIQPWDMLSLNVSCKGSGPFNKCLYFHRGKYNVTGNETCDSGDNLYSCNFSIIHYFLEPSVYTILIILNNDVSEQIYPLTINIYKVTTKPQLSVIVVPVSCSLAAVVLVIFGIAYYIQNKARFTVEVADFDFGQNNPEMEYKTFTERLRDSVNDAVRPGNKRISVRQPYYGSMNH